ncbi:hypothetical protein ETQ85_12520 [Zoogloea oleivorans]|uniref:Uncharacterized protein n=1 Tax=Zoogloea oleivorans TaxID=1552750 RepID=A0A6C2CRX5_9RHOO|nr:hypothetical protein ETQ85_12520 [Zoogloea oleivorans]
MGLPSGTPFFTRNPQVGQCVFRPGGARPPFAGLRGRVDLHSLADCPVGRIVGWRVSSSMCTDFVVDALGQALYASQAAMPP